MANSDAPRGLQPIKMHNGCEVEYLWVTSTLTADIGVGTPMQQLASGFVSPVTATTSADQTFVGVSMEFRDGSEGTTKQIAVNTNPFQKYLVQCSITTAPTIAILGASVGFTTPDGVNTTTGLSKCEVGDAGTTSAAPLRVVDRHQREGNDWGVNVDLIVQPIAGLHRRNAEDGV